ncbi:Txe/YoeB family addiction module toxin [Staphylococcus argenteus]|uniref:Txe/YoeB family addiction module toxin n=1 Tax=Staphylococcus argenteus TaxID=985002 RepID=UPI00090FA306|nr:Txe/YoeB family addiction module toxin [Staphylococcus argenteus]MCG9855505.1 Txe/YoeB family addiction module toxin [Staphylococcus argenteus]MDR7649651.1 Txe/YoeB family addiction module toxin [Staphylococcus argenteus]MDR7682176.1 Txe/YoeB family addiction module toxin [Staphylococcus argenteus]SGW85513.1 addiction module toxin [Staphylococcus argenteus]SGX55355.1 addiction module toxin [Staphylococcus argenteus]
MSNYTVKIKKSAKSDFKKIKNSYLKKSFLKIVETLKNDPYKITQSFEKLEPKYLERYLRRINHQHRVVYTVDDRNKEVLILSAWSHYD